MNNSIVVLGATGKTGRRLVKTLRDADKPVRAASRSSAARFDWSDQDTWPAVLDGAAAIYLVAPGDPAPIPTFVKQATEAGVGRFVALSGRELDNFPTEFFRGMRAAEQSVRDSGVEWTILRPNNFSQNFDEDAFHGPLLAGRLGLPIGAVPEPFIDVRDIAAVAAAALTTDGHHEQVYDLSGPRALTWATAVEKIAKSSGRTIDYVELTPAEFRDELLAEGWPESAAAEMNALFAGMRAGLYSEPRDGVQRALGRDPIDFDTYVAGAWS